MAAHKKNEPNCYDIIIVGGGLSGMVMACLLGQAGISVACLDAAPSLLEQKRDLRTTAVTYGSSQILEKAGVWSELLKRACPIKDIRILDGDSPVLLDFMSSQAGVEAFGWIVENYDMRSALAQCLAGLKPVRYMTDTLVKGIDVSGKEASCMLRGGETLKAQLIIGADGRGSFIREYLNIPSRGWNYRQRAVICNVSHEASHNNIAVEHFWPEGPFAILPMCDDEKGNHRSSVVFTEHGERLKSRMNMNDETFEAALAARFPSEYGAVKLISKRMCFPLSLNHARRYIDRRVALIADAAHGIHPIAGQGLNLGFRDIAALADLLIETKSKGEDIGKQEVLEQYETNRLADNIAMAGTTDMLVKLFSNNFLPVRFLRRAGLRMVSKCPPAKRFFMRWAMGRE